MLAGHSQSCQVVAVAARDPRVAAVVLFGPTTDPRLRDVRVPVTVVRGTRDRLCPHDWATRLAAAAPRGRLVEIPGAAHMTPQTHADEVVALVRDAVLS